MSSVVTHINNQCFDIKSSIMSMEKDIEEKNKHLTDRHNEMKNSLNNLGQTLNNKVNKEVEKLGGLLGEIEEELVKNSYLKHLDNVANEEIMATNIL